MSEEYKDFDLASEDCDDSDEYKMGCEQNTNDLTNQYDEIKNEFVNEANDEEQPLDLTRKPSIVSSQKATSMPVKVQLPNQQQPRRSYSKEELDRAIADIQSGRIGTRRASVLYGIPRSTLRNKVFRLNNQRSNNPSAATQPQKPSVEDQQATPQSIDFNQKDHILNEIYLKLMYERIMNLSQQSQQVQQPNPSVLQSVASDFIQSQLNNVMFKLVKDMFENKSQTEVETTPEPRPQSQPQQQQRLKNNTSTAVTHKPLTSLSTQNQHKHHSHHHHPYPHHHKPHHYNSNSHHDFNSSKQKRAKRGQYRKYESDQLYKAVDAVLNGHMSVHKAGSHFGVPHSTLEYKVKEKTMKSLTEHQKS